MASRRDAESGSCCDRATAARRARILSKASGESKTSAAESEPPSDEVPGFNVAIAFAGA
jgi:hypothetical protein